ncbi:acyl carrier protein [Vibrio gigantis]|uniref:acyl carrier protein n=1 Tax=Vibrio gigantis TaxID=296199 RepID=UPI003D0C390B
MNFEKKINEVFKSALELAEDANFEKLNMGSHPNWDSISHMILIDSLENEFNLSIEMDDFVDLNSYHRVVDFVMKNVKE